jgi:negative regulator of replication initiation
VTIWKELLQLLSGILYNLDPRVFEDSISTMRGNSRRYFDRDPERVRMRSPRRVGRSPWYVETHWDNDKTYFLCVEMLQRFGYSENDLELDVGQAVPRASAQGGDAVDGPHTRANP